MFKTELTEGRTINNDTVEDMTLEMNGWVWKMWLLEERGIKNIQKSSVHMLKAPIFMLFQLCNNSVILLLEWKVVAS